MNKPDFFKHQVWTLICGADRFQGDRSLLAGGFFFVRGTGYLLDNHALAGQASCKLRNGDGGKQRIRTKQ